MSQSQQEIIYLIQHLSEDIEDDEIKTAIYKCICISMQKYNLNVPQSLDNIKESFVREYSLLNDMIIIPEDLNDELNSLYETIGK
jgi:hypothetical protein